MKWLKPTAINRRYGFEVTMYVYIASAKRQKKSIKSSKTKAVYLSE